MHKRVLLEWVRIIGLENKKGWKYDTLLNYLATVIIEYKAENHSLPFTWPTGAGKYKGIPAIRAKVGYEFWRYFIKEGRKKLSEYNKSNGTHIAILRELPSRTKDEDNLGLLLRKKIADVYKCAKKEVPAMCVKKGVLSIGQNIEMKSAVAAIKFGFDLPEWKGLTFVEMLTGDDRKDYFEGRLKRGSMILPGFENGTNVNVSKDRQAESDGPSETKKRSGDALEQTITTKLPK
ncbi:hypothetical protein OSTOST_05851 [Ostertagia ostertagi]